MSFRKPLLESLLVLISYQVRVKSYLKRSARLIKHGYLQVITLFIFLVFCKWGDKGRTMGHCFFFLLQINFSSQPQYCFCRSPESHLSMPPSPTFSSLHSISTCLLSTNFSLSVWTPPLTETFLDWLDHYHCLSLVSNQSTDDHTLDWRVKAILRRRRKQRSSLATSESWRPARIPWGRHRFVSCSQCRSATADPGSGKNHLSCNFWPLQINSCSYLLFFVFLFPSYCCHFVLYLER